MAAAAGDAWEILGSLNGAEYADSNMDYWNNYVGRQIGRKSSSRDEIAEKVAEALNKGGLIIDKTGTVDKREFPFDLPVYQKYEKGIDRQSKLNQIDDITPQEREKIPFYFKVENESTLSNSYLANLSPGTQKLIQQCDEKFTVLCERRGVTADHQDEMDNVKMAAAYAALNAGLTKIDKMDFGENRTLFMLSHEPHMKLASLSTDEAVNIPVSQSMANIHIMEQQNAQQAQERQMTQSQQQNQERTIG